jgi:hypothetical protein
MPIGTSDGQHFEDEFHQGVEMLKQKMAAPLPLDQNVSSNIEDRRVNDPTLWPPVTENREITKNYLSQDLSKYEKSPLSIEAGINHIPTQKSDPIRDLLNGSQLQKAFNNPQIDRTHEVPYIAGASKDPNDFTTHVDKSVPTSVTISGKTFDPAIPLHIHEQIERSVMEHLIKGGMKEDKAYQIAHHEYAQVAEDNWYRQNGIDVNEVDKFWSKINSKTEKDKGDFPPNLYTKPYPHDKVEGEKHTPSNVFQEWSTTQK